VAAALTRALSVYKYIVLGNQGKTRDISVTDQLHIAPQLIALESCSNPQKTRQVFESAIKKFLVLGYSFFMSGIISSIGFWPFLAAGT